MADAAETVGNDIIGAVDGEGDAFLPGFHEDEGEATSETAPVEGAETVAAETPAEPEPEAEVDPLAEAERLFGSALGEGEDPVEPAPEVEEQGRANTAIRDLRARSQQAEQHAGQLRQQMQQQAMQHQETMQQMQQQMAHLTGRMEASARPTDPNDPNQYVDKFKSDLYQETDQRYVGQTALDERDERIARLEQHIQQEQQTRRTQAVSQKYNHAADQAAQQHLLSGLSPEDAQELAHPLGTLVLNRAYATRQSPEDAAKTLRPLILKYARASLRAEAAKGKAARAASQAAPTAPTTGRGNSNARGTGIPTLEEARDAGHKDQLAAMFAQDGLRSGT